MSLFRMQPFIAHTLRNTCHTKGQLLRLHNQALRCSRSTLLFGKSNTSPCFRRLSTVCASTRVLRSTTPYACALLPVSHVQAQAHHVAEKTATPSEIEVAAAQPSHSLLKRALQRLLEAIDDWILEPILTLRRFAHLLLLFLPVLATAPIMLYGRPTSENERSGTIWWFDFFSTQMEKAGPTFIKLAQWIASRTDLFPMALCTRLSKLHSQVDPHPFGYTKRVIEEAFDRKLEDIFLEFGPKPLGVGAIAQVYKARIRPEILIGQSQEQLALSDNVVTSDSVRTHDIQGNPINIHTAVAVKIIHPRARQIVDRDLKIMAFFARVLTLIPTFHWLSLPDEVQVFGRMMKEQLDLRGEAHNLQRFNELFGKSMQIKFPKPLIHFTTKDMLLEEYEKGIPLDIFLKEASRSRRQGESPSVFDHKIADIGLDAFLHMLIFYNFVHADLHPGNIIVKFYKPSAYHPVQRAWSHLLGRKLVDEGDLAVERVLSVCDDTEAMREELEKLHDEGYSPRLVFIDTGLINELNDVNRRNFLDLFQAIASFNGYRAGELMVERCRTPELVVDPDVFALRMQKLILGLKQSTFNLGAIKIGNLLHEAMNMVRAHHVKLEGDFVNIVVSIMLLEGIGRQLDPDVDLFKSALPVLRDYSMQNRGKATLEGMREVQKHGSTPHWIKVWVFLEFRNYWGRNTRDEEWMQLCDILCPN
ncbi:uncharacterized protein BYT42DRAFT_585147 [Radiomyces spectabilis]|uniref:uncharacterized protein n=1 Tax=Radiomyces spectabilis TaxID=64574 RepID=UPI00221E9326|nr:uncharacterized protein BYT42DRAFT_585147 [Radiomyces spectabilis]KAI8369631.1 hypothetical protein BYT42DRAFT_585147 [Radiomyces spectabilis]